MNQLFKIAILVSLVISGTGIKGLSEPYAANLSSPANQSGSVAGNPALDTEGTDRLGILWEPFLEWELYFPGYEGNPFDLEARVVFTHKRSGEKISTGIFYDGNDTWKFRFTGTRTGLWTFESTSGTEAFNGYSGRVIIEPNPDLDARGFISSRGNRFVRQGPTEHDEDAFIPNVWINYRNWGSTDRAGWTGISSTFADPSMVEAFLDDAASHGMNAVQAIIANQWFTKDVARWDHIDNENPDPETFHALENAIIQAHQRGMFIHIWMWGDEERRWTPAGLTGGINGEADRRVQRYIAARLGPLPGWTMGKGIDLMEWTTTGQVAEWVDYLQEQSGWPRMLGGREERTFLTPGNTNYLSHDLRMDDNFYSQATGLIDYAAGRPVWLTRRFTWMRDNVWDVNTTRRALWQFTMAGGVGAIWGHFPPGSSPYKEGNYDKEQMTTYSNFWRDRFLLEMEPANDLSDGSLVLKKKWTNFVFYKEDAGLIQIDLSSAAGPLRAIAIDARADYKEIDIGIFDPAGHRWVAPYNSDWAVAVGNFGNEITGKAENRLRIYPDNARYLEYNGDPVVIASKTFGWTMPGNVFFDHAKDIKIARDNGGNFLRITLFWPGQGEYYEFALPWKKDTETGLYDLDHFNDLYFDRLQYVLSLARHHDMIVNLEIWDTPAVKDRPTRWPDHPMNPVNNINYDADQLPSGSAERLFFRTLPELDDKPVALHYTLVIPVRSLCRNFILFFPHPVAVLRYRIPEGGFETIHIGRIGNSNNTKFIHHVLPVITC